MSGTDHGVTWVAPSALEIRNCGPSSAFAAVAPGRRSPWETLVSSASSHGRQARISVRTWRLMDAALPSRFPLEMLDDVSHVDPVARNADPSQHPIQHLPSRTDKRSTGNILVVARLFADEHDPRAA